MIYSLPANLKHLIADSGEIQCAYNRLGDIFDFIKKNPHIRCNIDLCNGELNATIYRQIDYIAAVAKDYTIKCNSYTILVELLEQGYNAYFDNVVVDWETFNDLLSWGVSDIYIDGPLCFEMVTVKSANVKIRVTPHKSMSAAFSRTGNANMFFIRPEDVDFYSEYIDIIDFNEPENRAEILYDIYTSKKFTMELNLLIPQIGFNVNNICIKSDFAERRFNCGQRCKIPGRSCHYCENYFIVISKLLN